MGAKQVFIVPKTGTYRLETWGSQGGSGVNKNTETNGNTYYVRSGGYGAYSLGYINLNKSEKIFLNVGGGGSGYIGNSLLTNKSMYCYNCE
ncbi:MAG TPA: hypothetical protein DHU33_04975 [Firmicutes bacterium]|nr:hypothetical protein [Bacillota bacterium]